MRTESLPNTNRRYSLRTASMWSHLSSLLTPRPDPGRFFVLRPRQEDRPNERPNLEEPDFRAALTQRRTEQERMHPSFRAKKVYTISCKFCEQSICKRGMKAILLADTRIELVSTDFIPEGRTQLLEEDYTTRTCKCRIRDIACLGCGNNIGYHVSQPCQTCMESCNNGHFSMFHSDAIITQDRMEKDKALVWADIPSDETSEDYGLLSLR